MSSSRAMLEPFAEMLAMLRSRGRTPEKAIVGNIFFGHILTYMRAQDLIQTNSLSKQVLMLFGVPVEVDNRSDNRLDMWDQECLTQFDFNIHETPPKKILIGHWKDCLGIDNFEIVRRLKRARYIY